MRGREETNQLMPPGNLRCKRNDGKMWRCNGWRLHGKSQCEIHYLQSRKFLAKGSSSAAGVNSNKKDRNNGVSSITSGNGNKDSLDQGYTLRKKRKVGNNADIGCEIDKEANAEPKSVMSIKKEVCEDDFVFETKKGSKNVEVEEKIKTENGEESNDEYDVACSLFKCSRSITLGKLSPDITQELPENKIRKRNNDFQMCHQCQLSDRKVVECVKCKKRYCVPCLQNVRTKKEIRSGQFGIIYHYYDREEQRDVAVKVIQIFNEFAGFPSRIL